MRAAVDETRRAMFQALRVMFGLPEHCTFIQITLSPNAAPNIHVEYRPTVQSDGLFAQEFGVVPKGDAVPVLDSVPTDHEHSWRRIGPDDPDVAPLYECAACGRTQRRAYGVVMEREPTTGSTN